MKQGRGERYGARQTIEEEMVWWKLRYTAIGLAPKDHEDVEDHPTRILSTIVEHEDDLLHSALYLETSLATPVWYVAHTAGMGCRLRFGSARV